MYNEEYLFQVEQAIQKLQSGERVVSIAYGDHVVIPILIVVQSNRKQSRVV